MTTKIGKLFHKTILFAKKMSKNLISELCGCSKMLLNSPQLGVSMAKISSKPFKIVVWY